MRKYIHLHRLNNGLIRTIEQVHSSYNSSIVYQDIDKANSFFNLKYKMFVLAMILAIWIQIR